MPPRETVSIVWDRDGRFFQNWTSSFNGDGMGHAEAVARQIGGSFRHVGDDADAACDAAEPQPADTRT